MKVAVVGAGKLGIKIVKSLIGGNTDITLIDKNANTLEKWASQMDVLTIEGNAKDVGLLQGCGIGSYDFLITTTDSDEKNLVISKLAKSLGCKKTIARVRDPEYMNHIDTLKDIMSVNYIVNPDLAIAGEIYKYLVEKYTLTGGKFTYNKVSFLEFSVKRYKKLIGTEIRDVGKYLPEIIVVAIDRKGKVIIPRGNTVIEDHDILYIAGQTAKISALDKKVHERGKYTDIQRVMIIGGGKTGLYLAEKLEDFGCSVKIVEIDRKRCYYLSSRLDNVLIINGDGSDPTLLEEENLTEMDACVMATGYDEDNLMLALMAKQNGIDDVIAKISRESYTDLIEKMGIDIAINPLNISASNILSFIQGSKHILSPVMIQGQAEIIDVRVKERMKFINKPIRDINVPDSMIIGAIYRGRKLVIPTGDTEIHVDDHIMVLTLLSGLADFEQFIKRD